MEQRTGITISPEIKPLSSVMRDLITALYDVPSH